jgi:hypothetical protein
MYSTADDVGEDDDDLRPLLAAAVKELSKIPGMIVSSLLGVVETCVF